jgi:23S rRNA G2445 N2-methylase RlmL
MTYIVHVVPGLEELAQEELERAVPGARVVRVLRRFDERTSILVVHHGGSPDALLRLKLAEDVFVLAAESDEIEAGWQGLAAIRAVVSSASSLPAAANTASSVRGRGGRKGTFRVVARKAGSQAFRRVDLQHAVEQAVRARYPGWRLVEDDARLELWVHLVGQTFIAGFRLSDITMRQRTYRRQSIPDVFLDPMCGSGTILIERAEAGRYQLLLGGDGDPAAVAATRANIGPRYRPIEIRQWDARHLPLGDRSVSALVTNLPFGKQIGTPAEVRSLYPALLQEWTRVLAPAARMVLLTGDQSLLTRAVKQHTDLVLKKTVPVLVRGYQGTVFVVQRRGAI